LETELTDPDAAVVPEGEEKPIASVEALQRLARTLEGNIFDLERKYGYKKTPEEIAADKAAADAKLKQLQDARAALVAKRDAAKEAIKTAVNVPQPSKGLSFMTSGNASSSSSASSSAAAALLSPRPAAPAKEVAQDD